MFLPSQEKALGILQCLETIEKTGELPKEGSLPFCKDAHKWSARELLYNLSEFMEVEEPNFYQNKQEQNDLLAEEAIRSALNTNDWASEAFTVLAQYGAEIPKPEQRYKVTIKNGKLTFSKNTKQLFFNNKDTTLTLLDPKCFHLWQWPKCSLLLCPMEAILSDRDNYYIQQVVTKLYASPQELKALVVCDTKTKKFSTKEDKPPRSKSKVKSGNITDNRPRNKTHHTLHEDMWYELPESFNLDGLSWLTRNYMGVENILETLDDLRLNRKSGFGLESLQIK